MELPDSTHADWPRDVRPLAKPMRLPRNRPLTPGEVNEAIRDMLLVLEDDVDELEQRNLSSAIAEAEYRTRKAQAMLRATEKTAGLKESRAIVDTAGELKVRNIAVALRDSAQEAIRMRRGELEALRTIAASTRTVETGRG